MNTWLLLPPVVFAVVFAAVLLQYWGMRVLSSGEKWPSGAGKLDSYACGEDVKDPRVQPDYSQFFPFAFFFTIMHVVALVVATMPRGLPAVSMLAALYLVASAIGLFILFRR